MLADRRRMVLSMPAQLPAELVTDGLTTYFDFRTCSYNNTGSGGKTIIYSSDGNYSSYAWANNLIDEQSNLGVHFTTTRSHSLATTLGGTTDYITGGTWTAAVQCYKIVPKFMANLIAAAGQGIQIGAPYYNTSNQQKVTTKTTVQNGYGNGHEIWMPYIARASADKFEVFDRTGAVIYTKNASDITDWASWKSLVYFGAIATQAGSGCTFLALYDNKVLTDDQVATMMRYMKQMEV